VADPSAPPHQQHRRVTAGQAALPDAAAPAGRPDRLAVVAAHQGRGVGPVLCERDGEAEQGGGARHEGCGDGARGVGRGAGAGRTSGRVLRRARRRGPAAAAAAAAARAWRVREAVEQHGVRAGG